MLTHIDVRNYALIDHIALDFSAGMTVLTGETGAGKSILVDALGLVLGDRADGTAVRPGADKAEISVTFMAPATTPAHAWLTEHDLLESDDCILRRVITGEGRSKAYINGRPVSAQMLMDLGALLVDIHGQHEHQSLLRGDIQRQLLDDYAGNAAWLTQLQEICYRYKTVTHELNVLKQRGDSAARGELLRYQIEELVQAEVETLDLAQLEQEHTRLAHAGRLQEGLHSALLRLTDSEEGAVIDSMARALSEVEHLRSYDAALSDIAALLNNARIQLDEAVNALRRHSMRMDLDPERLQHLDERLTRLYDLARKYRCAPQELATLLQTLQAEHDALQNSDAHVAQLTQERAALLAQYRPLANALSTRRQEAAQRLSADITRTVQPLGLPHACFEITLTPLEDDNLSAYGRERVEFLISANPGLPPRSLAKTASGGELSRVSLAVEVITHSQSRIPVMVFDEVDTGIGGAVAEHVGRQLRALGVTRQVLCVTHLPQVAALAHHHLRVSKAVREKVTHTQIEPLNASQRIDEIARMLGGIEISKQTRAAAKALLTQGSLL